MLTKQRHAPSANHRVQDPNIWHQAHSTIITFTRSQSVASPSLHRKKPDSSSQSSSPRHPSLKPHKSQPILLVLHTSARTTATMLGLGGMQPRQLATQILNFALVLSTAFMLWKGLSVATDSPSPIVVVLSGSMEPAFQRGDLLFLWNRGLDTQVGEIVVYNVKGKDIPIVHRVVRRYGGG